MDSSNASGWSSSLYNKHANFVYSAAFTSPVLELLAAKPGERIIDFGCGSGEVTLVLKNQVEAAQGGVVVGVDFSESMVCVVWRANANQNFTLLPQIAQAKANGLEHAFVSDVQALGLPSHIAPLTERFDAVFTNAALHWCKSNPAGVLESVKKVLKKGGRFTGEMGGFMNIVGLTYFYRVRFARKLIVGL